MSVRRILTIASLVGLTGCSALTPPARLHELSDGRGYWFDYDASRRGSLVLATKESNGGHKLASCAEPAPDVAVNLASKIEGQVSYTEISAKAKSDLALSAVKLAERTQMVMFFREALFRLCEIAANQGLTNGDVSSLYEKIINTALRLGADKQIDADIFVLKNDLAQKEAAIAAAAAIRAQAEAEKAKAQDATERQGFQRRIEELNGQIAKMADEQKGLASRLAAASQVKQAEATADLSKANLLQQSGTEISKDPSKALPSQEPVGK